MRLARCGALFVADQPIGMLLQTSTHAQARPATLMGSGPTPSWSLALWQQRPWPHCGPMTDGTCCLRGQGGFFMATIVPAAGLSFVLFPAGYGLRLSNLLLTFLN